MYPFIYLYIYLSFFISIYLSLPYFLSIICLSLYIKYNLLSKYSFGQEKRIKGNFFVSLKGEGKLNLQWRVQDLL